MPVRGFVSWRTDQRFLETTSKSSLLRDRTMSLSANDIEGLLLDGFSCSAGDREFVVKLDPRSDQVVINEMSRLARGSLSLDYILDAAHADESGSELNDQEALRRFAGQLAAGAV